MNIVKVGTIAIVSFDDRLNQRCSLVSGSCDDSLSFGQTNCAQMHLTREHVTDLVRHLQNWLDTGSFEDAPKSVVEKFMEHKNAKADCGCPSGPPVVDGPPGKRDLETVLCEIIALVPELEASLEGVRQSYRFTPPEMASVWWRKAAGILEHEIPPDHPMFTKTVEIFAGQPPKAEHLTSTHDPSNDFGPSPDRPRDLWREDHNAD